MREAEAQKQLALQYRYDALKAQVNPHKGRKTKRV
jgi:hypothetical protein